ncbi:MAG TPA: class I SAM-dependent DNA methyltransferase, partial [Candidatus Krumholzibacteria bacterium]|nr:class I SAM-dependent DNA methyltransferase [Candidatus Krumholzibacteria bacterium]
YFHFDDFIGQLDEVNLLYQVARRFREVDLSPDRISNYEMGLVFEELIRRFAESSNETAGEHFTPRDVVRLVTSLVFMDDDGALSEPGVIRTIYDPTAGTGGFLSSGVEYLEELNRDVVVRVFGQELNPESYAICKADMLIKGQDVENIKYGNTLSEDQLPLQHFDFMLSNPPFGVDWKKVQKQVEDERRKKGFNGRFGPGTPRVSDGSMLFLLHLISKMKDPKEGGSRIGIILNGSPLFTGGAGSGESEIRRYILGNDLLEGIVALPTDMFYNTGIATYVWVLSNRKRSERRGKVQLVNATEMFGKMRRSLGSKRNTIEEQAEDIVRLYGAFEENERSKIFATTEFGYRRITVERPLRLAYEPHHDPRLGALQADKGWAKLKPGEQQALLAALATLPARVPSRKAFHKQLQQALVSTELTLTASLKKLLQKHLAESDESAELCLVKGKPEADPNLRDYENVPLSVDVDEYFAREVQPHVPNAWVDRSKTDPGDGDVGVVGYEVPFNRKFYKYVPPRDLGDIDADLAAVLSDMRKLFEGLSL